MVDCGLQDSRVCVASPVQSSCLALNLAKGVQTIETNRNMLIMSRFLGGEPRISESERASRRRFGLYGPVGPHSSDLRALHFLVTSFDLGLVVLGRREGR